jgi:hypothetical protein
VPANAAIVVEPSHSPQEEARVFIQFKPVAPLAAAWHRLKVGVPPGYTPTNRCAIAQDGTISTVFRPDSHPTVQAARVCGKADGYKVSMLASERIAKPTSSVPIVKVTIDGKQVACQDITLPVDAVQKDGSAEPSPDVSVVCPAWPKDQSFVVTYSGGVAGISGNALVPAPGYASETVAGALQGAQESDPGCVRVELKGDPLNPF